jgi:hypothetical protein
LIGLLNRKYPDWRITKRNGYANFRPGSCDQLPINQTATVRAIRKNLCEPCPAWVLGIGDRCACIGFAQRRSAFCVRMVRDTPQACIHPINAIKFLIE